MRLLCKVGNARVRGEAGVVDVKVQKRRKRGGIRARVIRVVVEGTAKEDIMSWWSPSEGWVFTRIKMVGDN